MCSLLTDVYPKGVPCKFCKPDRSITNGKYYGLDTRYGNPKKLMVMRIRERRNEGVYDSTDWMGGKHHRI